MVSKKISNYIPPVIKKLIPHSVGSITRKLLGIPVVRFTTLDRAYNHAGRSFPLPKETLSTPETTNMQFATDSEWLKQETYSPPLPYNTIVPSARYCPTNRLLLSPDNEVVAESLRTGVAGSPPNGVVRDPNYPFEPEALKTQDTQWIPGYSTSYQCHLKNYYHILIDNIPRLLLLHDERFSDIDEIKILVTEPITQEERFFLEKFRPDNSTLYPVEKGSIYNTERFIFTSFLTDMHVGYIPYLYIRFIRQEMLPSRPSKQTKRIHLSRQKASKRRIINVDEVTSVFDDFGFETMFAEDLSIKDKIDVFYDAEIVAGAHGAGFTNVIFSGKTKVLDLHPTWYVVPNYYYLSKTMGHEYTYICGEEDRLSSDFTVDTNTLRQTLEKLCASNL